MKNQIKAALLIAALTSSATTSGDDAVMPVGDIIKEVLVLSMQFEGSRTATIVGRPCDLNIECDKIYARTSSKTIWRDGKKIINYKRAKELEWEDAVLVLDSFNNALVVERMSYDN